MNKIRKIINTLGLFSICGALLIILGIGLYNINKHRVTNTDKRNIEHKKQTIIENEKSAVTTLVAIMKMTSFLDDAENEIAKYFAPDSYIKMGSSLRLTLAQN